MTYLKQKRKNSTIARIGIFSLQLRVAAKSAGYHSLHGSLHMGLSPAKAQIKICTS
jgi:hypothetical protein